MEMKKRSLCLMCFLLPVFLLSPASSQATTNSSSCSVVPTLIENLSAQLKIVVECAETHASQWGENDTAILLDSLRRTTDVLQKHQKTVCLDAVPTQCPAPVVHSKGGLVCVTIKEARYCKPMCNKGYDFSFLRRSRLYEICSAHTRYLWNTFYVGGNKLAVCNKSSIQISGAVTAYFPKDQDCLKTKSDHNLEKQIIQTFVSELKSDGIDGNPEHECLICG
ncbi:uncharacterized protein si:ch1073-126c3.2 [Megalops cyprinoides]|uniref:uncharacterized protein si:ch1073-126c3.2 n=1 Tax=Megalops cyprinoides TaxID=118141 RepID=UPI001864D128|nr:uncharacterized protein si:ch1073-126c3.2 [Megalops cyprinoides]